MTIEQSSIENNELLNHFKEECSRAIERGEFIEREAKVLKLRFGLTDGHMRTIEEVGAQLGVTRERVRQIEAKALRKLRHSSGDCTKKIRSPGERSNETGEGH